MLAEYSTSVLDETDETIKLNEEGDELSLCVAVSEENLSTTRDLSETDTIVDTLLRGTVMDELSLSGAINEEKLSTARGQGETDINIIVNTRSAGLVRQQIQRVWEGLVRQGKLC